jgi:hypothetical protein
MLPLLQEQGALRFREFMNICVGVYDGHSVVGSVQEAPCSPTKLATIEVSCA